MTEFKPGGRPKRTEVTVEYIKVETRKEDDMPMYYCVECKVDVESIKMETHAAYIHRATMMRIVTRPEVTNV